MDTKISQAKQILDWMKKGFAITPADAYSQFGCLRLAARIADLRMSGHLIKTDIITTPSGKRVASYSLETLED